jgi:hypothetical protein
MIEGKNILEEQNKEENMEDMKKNKKLMIQEESILEEEIEKELLFQIK